MAKSSCCGGSARPARKQASCSCAETKPAVKEAPCSCAEARQETNEPECGCKGQEPWMTSTVETPSGSVPQVATKLRFADTFGSWKARWSIGRMDYAIEPGLYCVGTPNDASPVLVTANYKMTFDRVRKELSGVDAWILVLDTNGINVWCAAGKGTFGTEELVHRVAETELTHVVSHRKLILPQLGAAGVSAHEVAKQSGFHVTYGPVRAEDLKAFLSAGQVATKEMRAVRFTLWDRLVLTPLEVVGALKPSIIFFGILFILNAVGLGHYNFTDLYAWAGAVFVGCVLTPVLLPWLPGRAFALKGAELGLLWAAGVNLINGFPMEPSYGWLKAAAYMLAIPAVSSFIAMNFTGSSTFTSLSGVDKEMRVALPAMILAAAAAVILLLLNDILLVVR